MYNIEIADVFRQFGPSYRNVFGENMLPSHCRAIDDIMACRTQAMGGHVYHCDHCTKTFYVYHGCCNRSCPACHARQIEDWLQARTTELLPCPYYHVTVTVPEQLREIMRSNQSDCYSFLMKAAAEAVKALCRDKRYIGATPAILAVLHTWNAKINYHAHVHLLVSGGAIDDDGTTWREAKHPFLVPVRALSKLVRGKFHALLKKHRPDLVEQVPDEVWKKEWVAWCKHWGAGETAVLDYLGRYVHRIAITNGRITAMNEHTVTFSYKNRKKDSWHTCTLTGHEFMRRFLQHVLPKGFHKVRYYELWHPAKRAWQQNARLTLMLTARNVEEDDPLENQSNLCEEEELQAYDIGDAPCANPKCPHCGSVDTRRISVIPRKRPHYTARASPINDT